MTGAALHLKVHSPEGLLLDCRASLVELPGSLGRFEVLKGHAPIVTSLTEGDIRHIAPDGESHRLHICSGFAEVHDNEILVCAETL